MRSSLSFLVAIFATAASAQNVSSTAITMTTSALTTTITAATVLTQNSITYTITDATVLTITNCPCTHTTFLPLAPTVLASGAAPGAASPSIVTVYAGCSAPAPTGAVPGSGPGTTTPPYMNSAAFPRIAFGHAGALVVALGAMLI